MGSVDHLIVRAKAEYNLVVVGRCLPDQNEGELTMQLPQERVRSPSLGESKLTLDGHLALLLERIFSA